MNQNNPSIPDWLAPHVAEVESWGPIATTAHECWVTGCDRPSQRSGLCRSHFVRARRAWHPAPSEADRARQPQPEPPSR